MRIRTIGDSLDGPVDIVILRWQVYSIRAHNSEALTELKTKTYIAYTVYILHTIHEYPISYRSRVKGEQEIR